MVFPASVCACREFFQQFCLVAGLRFAGEIFSRAFSACKSKQAVPFFPGFCLLLLACCAAAPQDAGVPVESGCPGGDGIAALPAG